MNKQEKEIAIEEAVIMAEKIRDYLIDRILSKSTAHTNCDAEEICGIAQSYIRNYSE